MRNLTQPAVSLNADSLLQGALVAVCSCDGNEAIYNPALSLPPTTAAPSFVFPSPANVSAAYQAGMTAQPQRRAACNGHECAVAPFAAYAQLLARMLFIGLGAQVTCTALMGAIGAHRAPSGSWRTRLISEIARPRPRHSACGLIIRQAVSRSGRGHGGASSLRATW